MNATIFKASAGAGLFAFIFSLPAVAGKEPQLFNSETVATLAQQLASRPYEAPIKPVEGAKTSYDQYRDVRFKSSSAIWHDAAPYEIQLLPAGWLFELPIELHIVDNGMSQRVFADREMFDVGAKAAELKTRSEWLLSGFRINGKLNGPDKSDEIVVFQGASYFRALSAGQVYGTSARGLAIGTGGASPEEFPIFKSFWVERPESGARHFVVHVLMDSPSVTGAFRLEVRPGNPTTIRVEAVLHPRVELTDIGIAPLTSMHLFSPMQPDRVSDFRPRVHDADGLAIWNGNGEHLWRPLRNPRLLETSSFADNNPRGFGLIQRERSVENYLDFEAHYQRRPSTWIEPIGNWGPGNIMLFELPTAAEVHDNIVAFWRPSMPVPASSPFKMAYMLSWPDDTPIRTGGWVERSLLGRDHGDGGQSGAIRFAIDYRGIGQQRGDAITAPEVSAAKGTISNVTMQTIDQLGITRVSFLYDPGNATSAEIRLAFPPAETWVYRWSRD